MIRSQKPKLVDSSTTRKQELIEHIEGLAMKGVKTAILLAKLGDESSLSGVIAASLLAIKRGENLLRGLFPHEHRGKHRGTTQNGELRTRRD